MRDVEVSNGARPVGDDGLDVLTSAAAVRRFEVRLAQSGIAMATMMAQAADAVFDVAMAHAPRRAVVLVGPGNNGGDGALVAARLAATGVPVRVLALAARDTHSGDARAAALAYDGEWTIADQAAIDRFAADAALDLIVDGLFGIGLSRPLAGNAAMLCAAVARQRTRQDPPFVLAIGIPSGIDADSGAAPGPAIVADATVTFFAAKPGHVLYPGRAHCGAVFVRGLGHTFTQTDGAEMFCDAGLSLAINGSGILASLPVRAATAHKYQSGHVLVAAGGLEGAGAARLAARGALRAGAGLVTLAVPGAALLAHAGRPPDALMVRRADDAAALADLLADARRNVAVLGPALGIAPEANAAMSRAKVAAVLTAPAALLLDADALSAFAPAPDDLLDGLRRRDAPVVLTPHEGEFSRLFGGLSNNEQGDSEGFRSERAALAQISAPSKIHRAAAAALLTRQTIVLKGADTVIAGYDPMRGGVRVAVNVTGTADLATAGSGDVLAGIIAGLLARKMAPFAAAAAGVFLHAEAGREAGPGLIADDLPEALSSVFKRFFGTASGRGPR